MSIELENKISSLIHPTAIVAENAELGTNVKIGPFSIIGRNVKIGDSCTIGNNVTIGCDTIIGKKCKIFHSSSVGELPQDLKYDGERTFTIIGDNTVIREFVTINKGTRELGKTQIGSNVLLMASTHVAHDCLIEDNVIMSNLATLGGHVKIGEWAILGGGVLVHQFTKIGEHSLIGGGFRAVQDVPPFIVAANHPLTYKGVNLVGLKRRGFSIHDTSLIKKVYKIFFRSGINRNDAIKRIEFEFPKSKVVQTILDFINNSSRGII